MGRGPSGSLGVATGDVEDALGGDSTRGAVGAVGAPPHDIAANAEKSTDATTPTAER
jgi:hypothetical protein